MILTATNGRGFVIIQIFGEGIITCHRCHCCFASPFVPRLVKPLKSRRCLCVRRTPDLSNQLAALPSHESPRLCLKAVHLLLRGCVAMGERARAQVGIYLGARACRGVGGCRKYVICGFAQVDASAPAGAALLLSLQPWK